MKKVARLFAPAVLAGCLLFPAAAQAGEWHEGQMIYSADGQRIAPIYRVMGDGSVQLIVEGKMVTIPASALAIAGTKVTTTRSKAQLQS